MPAATPCGSRTTAASRCGRRHPTAAEVDWRQPYDLAVDNSRIYLAFTAKSGARKLVAFNLATGARVWSRTSKAIGAPAVANGVVFVAEGTDGVAAYDAANGNQLWRRAGRGQQRTAQRRQRTALRGLEGERTGQRAGAAHHVRPA